MMEQIKSAAEAFVKSYENTISLGQNYPNISTRDFGEAIASHYGPGFTSYTSGYRNTSGTREAEITSVSTYLDRLIKGGVGVHFELAKYHVNVVGAHNGGGSALCCMTWRVRPADGREGWSWENVYGFRLLPDDRRGEFERMSDAAREKYVKAPGYWEFVVSDNELEELVKRVPTIFSDTFGADK